MPPRWFSKAKIGEVDLWEILEQKKPGGSLSQVAQVLDYLHMHQGLLEAYHASYPLVEPAELIPPFDAPLIEYRDLPAFSLVALDRPLSYQDEGFQYDQFYAEGDPPDRSLAAANRATLRRRLPRNLAPDMDQALGLGGPTPVRRYVQLMPLLMAMDRGHVLARDPEGEFHLAGVFASFPRTWTARSSASAGGWVSSSPATTSLTRTTASSFTTSSWSRPAFPSAGSATLRPRCSPGGSCGGGSAFWSRCWATQTGPSPA